MSDIPDKFKGLHRITEWCGGKTKGNFSETARTYEEYCEEEVARLKRKGRHAEVIKHGLLLSSRIAVFAK